MADRGDRRLAAIMFADMVGYTALMQEDEDQAMALRDRQREVLGRLIPRHRGEILQYYGDGALSAFGSAVHAVECAIEIQLELQQAPEVPLRIGVHTGDVVHEEGGVYGDVVNVAARIEALAAPGGIVISGKVYDEIKNHPSISAASLGPVSLKNVAHPVSVFAIDTHGLPVPSPSEIRESTNAPGSDAGLPSHGPWDWPTGLGEKPGGPGEAFLNRVRERAVIPWALLYLVGAWAGLQIARFLWDRFLWPDGLLRGLDVLTFVGFFVVLVVAWHHGAKGRQPVSAREVGIISLLLALGAASLLLVRPDEGQPSQEGVPATAVPSAAPPEDRRPSIAVLPFDNFSPDPDDAYFANGVQEDVTTALSRVAALRVPARSSVERFRTDRPGTREMARALGADYLLEGSATVVGERAQVVVQLIDGRTDQHLWAEEYEYAFSVEKVIELRSALSKEVAARLRAIITPEEEARIATPATRVPEALERYQRARYRWNQRTEEAVRESMSLFQEAIDLDPSFADAYAGLADAFLVLSNWGWLSHREGHRRGIAAAERALRLDPRNASAHASLGALHLWSTRDWSLSEGHFLRAIELDPDNAYSHYWYSALLSALGRHPEAIRQAEEAEALDPLSPQISYGLARSYFLARDPRRAVQEAAAALEIHPGYGPLHAQLCQARAVLGEFGAAEAACQAEKDAVGVRYTLSMALLRALRGDRAGALAEMAGVREEQGDLGYHPIFVAMVYAGIGETDSAFEELQRAADEDFPYLEYLPSNPFFDPLRSDPRYQDLLTRVGLRD